MKSKTPLKLSEVRALIKKHDRKDLEYIIAQMYKMIPKDKKTDYDVASLIENPAKYGMTSKTAKKEKQLRPFDEVEKEVNFFVENAYEQNYLAPNRRIKKADRPKWRFVVKRLYKELNEYAKQEEYITKAADNLLKLYEVLTYSCHYYLFNSYDSFESTGIDQDDFFRAIIEKYNKILDRKDFIAKAIDIMFDNPLNRYTLYSGLMLVFLEFVQIPDMLNLTIEITRHKRDKLLKSKPSKETDKYYITEKINNYTELIFRCYANLYEFDNALNDFNKNMIEDSEEIKLYILIRLLMDYGEKDLILNLLVEGEKKMRLREGLIKMKNYIVQKNKLPDYMF